MGDVFEALIVLLCLLQAKHMFADYFLQTRSMLGGRDIYLHQGRFLHAGVHAAGSALAFLIMGTPVMLILLVAVGEWIAHYHIDWAKGRYTARQNLTPDDAAYWRATGVDQALHQLTYIIMLWCWLTFGIAG
ncbi:DUF3307 domain-containing protein [Roseobacter denitrificans]|uniref:DUF3307 domain-containing protein n=1 Tax=Roseobacter denitrificans (strain ATCC 33942 / OCh 114) TaxID=375451 RepID=Q167D9_ROSDO|nr:DUF3307 domain-containing protein [Roseobacter denitrificans]ABG31904.1 conserved hypothetical protein [Roseobacter denitrificans OCh 114]AVL51452.1 DUF3307 domain-containing protein [Roseobacter denitrificans]